jgi:hypothetical protein
LPYTSFGYIDWLDGSSKCIEEIKLTDLTRGIKVLPNLRRTGIVLMGAVLALFPSAVRAETPVPPELLLPVDAQIAAAITNLLASSSYCVNYTYDQNGNRTARTSAQIQAAPVVWGSGTYGCFVWGQ